MLGPRPTAAERSCHLRGRVQGFEVSAWGLGGSGLRVQAFRISGVGFRVEGLGDVGFRAWGLGLRIWGI